ncbi:MAG: PepSY domain-containing protein [Burkholderiales bacterium]|nr:PepSY domain-containing protein [Burkholderiales bacterium]
MKALFALLACLVFCAPMTAYADIGRDDAVAIAQRTLGGRVLAVDKVQKDGHDAWRVKVLTPQGEVRVLLIDAVSGRQV